MELKINKEIYRDKVYACWMGKNIGGTMGTPFEENPSLNNITWFTTPKGEPLPNDDLDIQLVWLHALEQVGPKAVNANILSWYWKRYVPALWNEYGIGGTNTSLGFTPPMSGELYNEGWKTSNGAWIRSEIWACLAPGFPNVAAKYAIMDASIDHGVSEGVAAEIFTSVLESLAFVESDIRTLIEKALTYIPEDCRVALDIKTVIAEYDKGTDWKKVREIIIERNRDFGFFQAPGNLAYMVIGLLYGEGDFLKSLLYAINCGDDTDCTAATIGALLGIIGGTKGIPKELSEYIGDKISSLAIDLSASVRFAKTCTELTDRVVKLMPSVMYANGQYMEFDNAICGFSNYFEPDCDGKTFKYFEKKPLSIENQNHWIKADTTFDGEPRIKSLGTITFRVNLENKTFSALPLNIRVYTPNGWSAEHIHGATLFHYSRSLREDMSHRVMTDAKLSFDVTVTANESIEAYNRVYVAVEAVGYPEPLLIPITILG